MECEDFMDGFDIDMEDDDCSICEKVDCSAESFMEHCEMNVCFDHCELEDKCFVHFSATHGDEMHKMDCDTFTAMMSGECVDVEEHGDCKGDIEDHVDDVRSCEYHVRFNTCDEESEECSV